jgi:quercetin dioxygenase-like cupin family protein
MSHAFPESTRRLPIADIPIDRLTACLSQAEDHQVLYMDLKDDIELKEHSHSDQIGFVLEGRVDLVIDGKKYTLRKGDKYHIPKGTKHSAFIHAGYADITVFMEKDRYKVKKY